MAGTVAAPPDDIFLVPQRVYSSMGSLMDQITYPQRFEPTDRTPAMEEEMRGLLRLVGVEFLVAREGSEETSGWVRRPTRFV